MDILIKYWYTSDNNPCQSFDKGAILKTKQLLRVNIQFIAGLTAGIYGTWGLEESSTILEISKKNNNKWIVLSKNDIDKILCNFIISEYILSIQNTIAVKLKDEDDKYYITYFKNITDKFRDGLKLSQELFPYIKVKNLVYYLK